MLAQVVLRRPLDLLVLASPRCLLDLRSQLADRPLGHPLRNAERRSEEHTSELQSRFELVWRLLLEKKAAILAVATYLRLGPAMSFFKFEGTIPKEILYIQPSSPTPLRPTPPLDPCLPPPTPTPHPI